MHIQKKKQQIEMDVIDRPFKLDLENRFLMLLVYYRLYITYTLTEFIFDWDQSNVCRDIQKIESLVRKCIPTPQKLFNKTKRPQTQSKLNNIFQSFLLLSILLQNNNRYQENL